MEWKRLFERSKAKAKEKYPYLSRIVGRLAFGGVVDELQGYMAVDKGGRVYLCPKLLTRLSRNPYDLMAWDWDALAEIVTHEALHILFNHYERGQGKVAEAWLVAADLAINDDLDQRIIAKCEMLHPSQFDLPLHLAEETYYQRLLKNGTVQANGRSTCGGGSGATGVRATWEKPDDDEESPALPDEALELIRDQVAHDILNHQKAHGDVPAWLERWAKDRVKVKINWERLIGRFVITEIQKSHEGKRTADWHRPNRRLDFPPFIMPRYIKRTPTITLIADTSGSMSDSDLAFTLAAIDSALQRFGQVTVVAWDAELKGIKRVTRVKELKDIMKGGGGTKMGDAVKWVAANVRPSLIIVLTDGETDWCEPVGVPTCAIIINETLKRPPAHIRYLHIKPSELHD